MLLAAAITPRLRQPSPGQASLHTHVRPPRDPGWLLRSVPSAPGVRCALPGACSQLSEFDEGPKRACRRSRAAEGARSPTDIYTIFLCFGAACSRSKGGEAGSTTGIAHRMRILTAPAQRHSAQACNDPGSPQPHRRSLTATHPSAQTPQQSTAAYTLQQQKDSFGLCGSAAKTLLARGKERGSAMMGCAIHDQVADACGWGSCIHGDACCACARGRV